MVCEAYMWDSNKLEKLVIKCVGGVIGNMAVSKTVVWGSSPYLRAYGEVADQVIAAD